MFFFKFIVKKILKILNKLIPKSDRILCCVEAYNNGILKENDNVYLFYKFLKKMNYQVEFCVSNKLTLKDLHKILTSKIIIHKTYPISEFFFDKKQFNIILGYFTPFKADRFLEKMCNEKYGKNSLTCILEKINSVPKNMKYITSSRFSSELIAKSNKLSLNNFVEIGMSRNEITGINMEEFKKIFSIKKEKVINKIILFTPTFRDKFVYKLEKFNIKDDNNIFGYDEENELSNILEEKGIHIIIKFHKFYQYYEEKEKKVLQGIIKLPSNCHILTSEIEQKYNIGIYNLFDISDAMIADYSSISFDYLLKDKPIFYNIFDIQEYREYRGFSYEPIEDLMAGEIITKKEEFISIIRNFGENYNDIFKNKRKKVNELVNGKNINVNLQILKFIEEFTKNEKKFDI